MPGGWVLEPPGVWRAELLSPDQCQSVCAKLAALKLADPAVCPRLSPERGLPLDELCPGLLDRALDQVQEALVGPRKPQARVEMTHAFVIEYTSPTGERHQPHLDDSCLTLNVCVGKEFAGGDLLLASDPVAVNEVYNLVDQYQADHPEADTASRLALQDKLMPTEPYQSNVRWVNGQPEPQLDDQQPEPMFVPVPHRVGSGLVHQGQHMHGADPVSSGSRVNVVAWLRLVREFKPWLNLSHNLMQLILAKSGSVRLVCLFAQSCQAMQQVCASEPLWQALAAQAQFECTLVASPEIWGIQAHTGRGAPEPESGFSEHELCVPLDTHVAGYIDPEGAVAAVAVPDTDSYNVKERRRVYCQKLERAIHSANKAMADGRVMLAEIDHPSSEYRRLAMLSDAVITIRHQSGPYSQARHAGRPRMMMKCLPDPLQMARDDIRSEVDRIKASPSCVVRACERWTPDTDLFPGMAAELDGAKVHQLLEQYLAHVSQRALGVVNQGKGVRTRSVRALYQPEAASPGKGRRRRPMDPRARGNQTATQARPSQLPTQQLPSQLAFEYQ